MPPILDEASVTADFVLLSDGRLARVQGYNPERTRFVAAFMTWTGLPPVCSPERAPGGTDQALLEGRGRRAGSDRCRPDGAT